MSVRKVVEDVLSPTMTSKIWTANYENVLPVSIQNFDLSAVLPAVFYMFRFGHRRGKGRFLEEFSPVTGTEANMRRHTTVAAIANKLVDEKVDEFIGFDGETQRAVLGDLLLCYCFDNVRNKLGRTQQVQRVAPTHFMSSWLDLPTFVAHLRYVPEMIVAMLADQEHSRNVTRAGNRNTTWFPVGSDMHDNLLLQPFLKGVKQKEITDDYAADEFDEQVPVGIDQLLTIRLAQRLRRAPGKLRGKEDKIPNQRPIATTATKYFSEDIREYVGSYATEMPCQAFVESLESCVAIGLTTITSSSIEIVLNWAEAGDVQDLKPTPLFVDCSMNTNRALRRLSEDSMDEYLRRARRAPLVLMAMRLLDYKARYDRRIKAKMPDLSSLTRPSANKWLQLLGKILHGEHFRSDAILDSLDEKTLELADKLNDDYPSVTAVLNNFPAEPNPVWRLAEGLTLLQGSKVYAHLEELIDSALHVDRPNGLAVKRRTTRTSAGTNSRRRMVLRSLVLSDSVLEYLVHRLSVPFGKGNGTDWLSFDGFIGFLRDRYGFYINSSPPGLSISNDLLQLNRRYLDRRLRDLGLLVSVNDAEAMKRLTPRFSPRGY